MYSGAQAREHPGNERRPTVPACSTLSPHVARLLLPWGGHPSEGTCLGGTSCRPVTCQSNAGLSRVHSRAGMTVRCPSYSPQDEWRALKPKALEAFPAVARGAAVPSVTRAPQRGASAQVKAASTPEPPWACLRPSLPTPETWPSRLPGSRAITHWPAGLAWGTGCRRGLGQRELPTGARCSWLCLLLSFCARGCGTPAWQAGLP